MLGIFVGLLIVLNLQMNGLEQLQLIDASFRAAHDELHGLLGQLEEIFANNWVVQHIVERGLDPLHQDILQICVLCALPLLML